MQMRNLESFGTIMSVCEYIISYDESHLASAAVFK